ncbi:MAG: hypothetical protein HC800_13435 [Phormidesmis sp. RL_2_1]|nr:hypothetical protein [Phormidesmis sp. RL_2_1]
MNDDPGKGQQSSNDDPFLIGEDAKVFSALVPSDNTTDISKFDEVSGLIAYARYSLQKHQFVIKYQQEEGRPPTADNIQAIIMSFKDVNSEALQTLKQKSESLLREYAEEYAENAKRKDILAPMELIVKKHTRFWLAVGTNLVAALIYSFIVAVILFTATAVAPNNKFSQIIKILMESQPEATETSLPDTQQ